MPPCPAWEERLAMEVGAGEVWAQESRKLIGEGDGVRIADDEILAGLDEEAGKSAARDFLVQRSAHERAIIGFVVADQKPVLGQRRDQRQCEWRIAFPRNSAFPWSWPLLPDRWKY
jgi:hypothetical protein